MPYAHLTHVNGEAGIVDYEAIVGPFDGFCLTYNELRETNQGDPIAFFSSTTGSWHLTGGGRSFSDISLVPHYPTSVVG